MALSPARTFCFVFNFMSVGIGAVTADAQSLYQPGQLDRLAEHFSRQFRSTGPLHVSAKVLKSYAREGCKRLEVLYLKKDVETPRGRTDVPFSMQMNYCRDGTPPLRLEGDGP